MSKYTPEYLNGMARFTLDGLRIGDPKSVLLIMRMTAETGLDPLTVKRKIQAMICNI